MDADGGRKRALVRETGDDVEPSWTPDGARLAFASNRSGHFELWSVPVNGGLQESLLEAPGTARAPAWSPDGHSLAYSARVGGATHIWLLDVDAGVGRELTQGPAVDVDPDWSPDGRLLAFTRVGGGQSRTWLVRRDARGDRALAGSEGDVAPTWALTSAALVPAPDERLPDLDQRAPAGLAVLGGGGRFRLGFASAVENIGAGPLRIRGFRPAVSSSMRADQIVERRHGDTRAVRRVGSLRYERHPPHWHWHFEPFERYELRRASDHGLVGRDRKSGFCLVDRYGRASRRLNGVRPPRFVSDCGTLRPQLRRVEEGSSRGYVDRYPAFFHGQDIDITNVPAGVYELVHRVNPDRLVVEEVYSNDAASLRIRISWPRGGRPPRITVLRVCESSERCPARR
jgi:hypothetical protein